MIISHDWRFVMFLPWKTASQTMVARLEPFNQSPYSRFFHFNTHMGRVVHQHMTCADFLCLPESREGYYLGSFVRNPYDRAYSGFRQLEKDIKQQRRANYFPSDWIRSLVLKQLDENEAQLKAADYDFDKWLNLVREEQVYEAGHNTNFPLHPSYYWTHVGGNRFVDFVGRVEQFEGDFAEFCAKTNIDTPNVQNVNVVDLEGESDQNRFGYRYSNRMNSASISKINTLFADDFDLFGYHRL